MKQLRPPSSSFALLTIVTGVVYPLAVTGSRSSRFRRRRTAASS
jgi:K+-transporting ATPase c subunit